MKNDNRLPGEMYGFALWTKPGEGIIVGGSMCPSLQKGYKVKTEPARAGMIQLGDIIVFGEKTLTCHRIVAKVKLCNSTYLIHKGDHSFIGGILKAEAAVAKVTEVFDQEGTLVAPEKWYRKPRVNMNVAFSIYAALYMAKLVFLKRGNRFSRFINRQCWIVTSRL
jgi:hypothetical protein